MTSRMYTRMQKRSQAMITDKGGLFTWGTGTVYGRDDDGNEVEIPASGGEVSGWAVLTELNSKIWGQEREPDVVSLVFSPFGTGGAVLGAFTKDTVIQSVAGRGKFIVIEEKPTMPDGETLLAVHLKVRSL